MGLKLTSPYTCETCGNPLSSSDEACDKCAQSTIEQMVFRYLTTERTLELPFAWCANHEHMWERVAEKSPDDTHALGWMWLGGKDHVATLCEKHNCSVEDLSPYATAATFTGVDIDE